MTTIENPQYDKARYIGIDIGKKGAIAWLDINGNILDFVRMPLNTEDDIDFMAVAKLIRNFPKDAHVITERLASLFGVGKASTFSFSRQCTIVECAILVNKLSWSKVNPKKWQSMMWDGQKMLTKEVKLDKEGTKKFKTDTKKISENSFRKLFPQHVNHKKIIVKSPKGIRLHDGIVDAVLLASYAKRSSL